MVSKAASSVDSLILPRHFSNTHPSERQPPALLAFIPL